MYAGVSLADAGYTDLLIFDSFNGVGGHCDTVRTATTWEEAGVIVYPDTALANQLGYGRWNLDVAAIVKRFAGEDAIIDPLLNNVPSYIAWVEQGLLLGGPLPATPPTPEFLEAFARYTEIMSTRLLWLDTLDHVPNPIPQELRVSLSEWIELNNLTAIRETFFATNYFYGGLGNLENITAFDGLLQRSISNLIYGNPQYPRAWFSVKNGCQSVYDGMRAYLGESSFRLGSTIESIRRPNNDRSAAPITIRGKQNGVNFVERCERLIVAIPPTLDNLAPLELSNQERDLFSSVTYKYYFTGILQAKGGTLANTGHLLLNIDPTRPGGRPPLPNFLISYRKFDTGPVVYQSFSERPITDQQMKSTTDALLAKLNQGGIYTNVTSAVQWKHQFNPTWSRDVLSQPIAPHNRLDALNGHLRTFYVGALRSTGSTMVIWHQTKRVIDRWFVEDEHSEENENDDSDRRSLSNSDHLVKSGASPLRSEAMRFLRILLGFSL